MPKTTSLPGFLAVGAVALGYSALGAAHAQTPSQDTRRLEQSCISQYEDLAAATEVGDWKSVARIGENLLTRCSQVATPEMLVESHHSIALALSATYEYKRAVPWANKCIELSYRTVGCHVVKAESLLRDGQLLQGRVAHHLASLMASKGAEHWANELKRPSGAHEPRLVQANLRSHEAYVNFLRKLGTEFGLND